MSTELTQTERRDIILNTIGQLGKFINMMHDINDNDDGYSDNEVKLLKVLGSFAVQAKHHTQFVKQDDVTDEPIEK